MTLDLDRLALDELADIVDSHDDTGYLDPETGELYRAFEGEVLGDDGEPADPDDEGWIAVDGEGSRGAYRDMETFAAWVPDRPLRQRLQDALRGRGAFRRFRDVMWDAPEQLGRAWQRYRGLGGERRAVRWLDDQQLVDRSRAEARVATVTAEMDAILDALEERPPATVVDLAERLSQVSDHWSPTVLARLNDYEVKVAKLDGEFVWHTHEGTDELFLVLRGTLTIQLRAGEVTLGPGQLYVVPRGVEHRPVTDGQVEALLIEPAGVVNTGDVTGDRAAPPDTQ